MNKSEQVAYMKSYQDKVKAHLRDNGEAMVDALFDKMIATAASKGDDYAKEDRLSNFKEAGALAGIGARQQCLTLVAVKVARLGSLMNQKDSPNHESLEDSMLDLTVYSILLRMLQDEPSLQADEWWNN